VQTKQHVFFAGYSMATVLQLALQTFNAVGTQVTSAPPFPPTLALLSGVLAISTGAIFARLAEAPALVIAAYRVGLAAVILAPYACWRARDELCSLRRRDYQLAILAGFFLALHFAAWISSLEYTSVATSVVLVNTNPLWVGLLTPLISYDRLRWQTRLGIGISVVGGIIIGGEDFTLGGQALWGDVLALLGSICAALYLLLGRTLRRRLSLLAYVLVCYGSAAFVLWTVVLVLRLPVTGFNERTYTMFLAMALVPQIIGHSSYNWALKWFSASLIAVSLLGEPIGSTLLAYLLLGEGLTWPRAVGGTLILTAIYLTARGEW
jgi:drug/metabolite transporter (DMT)-like permease